MDFKQGLATWAEACRFSPSRDRHRVPLVAVAHERESAALCFFDEPRIALRQRDRLPLRRNLPLQSQAGKRALHAMGYSERATVIAHEEIKDALECMGATGTRFEEV